MIFVQSLPSFHAITRCFKLIYILALVALLSTTAQEAWSEPQTKKATAKISFSAFVNSKNGSAQVLALKRGASRLRKVETGKAQSFEFPRGNTISFVMRPKKGYKAGILLNGLLERYQSTGKASSKAKQSLRTFKYKVPKSRLAPGAELSIEVRFVPEASNFSTDYSLVFLQLGNSIKVTNQNPVQLYGSVSSDVGIRSITLLNYNAGVNAQIIKANISEQRTWTADMAFVPGDNRVLATMTANDGSIFKNETVISYSSGLNFTTPLTTSSDSVFVGTPTDLFFNIGLADGTGASVQLIETNAEGSSASGLSASMADNGTLPDEIQSDGLFSAKLSVTLTTPGTKYFRAVVSRGGFSYSSELKKILVLPLYTNDEIQAAVSLANQVQQRYDALIAAGQSEIDAATQVALEIKTNPVVGAAGSSPRGAVWWITARGILGGYSPNKPGQHGGGFESPEKADSFAAELANYRQENQLAQAAFLEANAPAPRAAPAAFYRPEQLRYVNTSKIPGVITRSLDGETERIEDGRGLLISPFINNPSSAANFGSSDDLYVPWKVVQDRGSVCALRSKRILANDGSVAVTLSDFKDLSDYGLIHLSTHGDNLYHGLTDQWKSEYGPNDFMTGYYSLVVLASGVPLPVKADGSYDSASVSADLAAKRIAIHPGGSIYFTPDFFKYYLGALPKSLVILSACRSSYNSSMADAFLTNGAGAVLGFTDYVTTKYTHDTLSEIYTRLMVEDFTLADAISSAKSKFGANDADADPAALTLFGSSQLRGHTGQLANGGFEANALSPWRKEGDGRVIDRLGEFKPQSGSHMGVISTGLGYTVNAGSIRQRFCMPANAVNIGFRWNYSSEEFLEFCGSQFQDTFDVALCELDPQTDAELSCTTLLHEIVDTLCGKVTKVTFSLDKGDVYSTGWLTAQLGIPASLLGKTVALKFITGDTGDSIYDTAVLLDDIKLLF